MAENGNAAAMRLCDELIQAAYDADICSPGDLAHRVRKIKDAIGPSPQGNASAMREALSDACYAMFNFLKTQGGGYEEMAIALDKAKAALSAPPRNCDRFGSESEMRAAFIDWYNEVYGLKGSKYAIDTCDLKHDVDGILHDYIDWLIAPATEKEGEADGSK